MRNTTFSPLIPFTSSAIHPHDSSSQGAPATTERPTKEDVIERIRGKRLRILIVDDQDNFRESLAFKLRKKYMATVEDADTGEIAVHKTSQAYPFDLILLDISMPVMSGFETYYAIRARGIRDRIVLMSAHVTTENQSAAVALGVTFLSKPLDEDALLEVLVQCGDSEE